MTRTMKIVSTAVIGIALSGCAATRDTMSSLLGRDQAYGSLDTNGDGVLSRNEARALPDLSKAFDRIDTNNDDNINQREFRAANTMVVTTDFSGLDINGDGVISKREADSSRPSLREKFDQIDSDRDGNVSKAEFNAATTNLLQMVDFAKADLDGDGVLDRREVQQHPLVNSNFDAIDTNGDKLIGPDEFKRAQRN